MEDWEKKYEELFGHVQDFHKRFSDQCSIKKEMEECIPELVESEDERLRKKCIELIKRVIPSGNNQSSESKDILDCIAYLEKRKEQKPSPSIYWHAIKEGDTLPCRAYLWTTNYEKYHDCFEGRLVPNVENVTAGADMWYLPVDDVYNLPREGVDELPKEQKPALRLVGDGLVSDPNAHFELVSTQEPAEWSEAEKQKLNRIYEILGHAADDNGFLTSKRIIGDKEAIELQDFLKSLRPQPKQKEKKPLCIPSAGSGAMGTTPPSFKLDVKPAGWSEEDMDMLNDLLHFLIGGGLEHSTEDVYKWLKGLRHRFNLQPKQEWSEEDKINLEETLYFIREFQQSNRCIDEADMQNSVTCEKWLQDLPNRFSRQQKQEWSEEDEQYLLVCKNALNKYQRSDHWDANIISKWLEERLKSLRPQRHWKPSEEQMDILDKVYHYLWADRNATADMQDGLGDFIDELKEL